MHTARLIQEQRTRSTLEFRHLAAARAVQGGDQVVGVVAHRVQARDAPLLWPELDASRARADLRRTLSVLNRELGGNAEA
mgnify:CR=1 FL=1